jgi:hypothetical protein
MVIDGRFKVSSKMDDLFCKYTNGMREPADLRPATSFPLQYDGVRIGEALHPPGKMLQMPVAIVFYSNKDIVNASSGYLPVRNSSKFTTNKVACLPMNFLNLFLSGEENRR